MQNMQICSYMKRHVILLLLAVMFAATGCDFFRNLAGRPTSEDIVRRKIELMHAEEARLEARLDSLRQAVRTMQDSLNTLDTISSFGGKIMNTSDLGGLFDTELQARYYVIIGSFKSRSYTCFTEYGILRHTFRLEGRRFLLLHAGGNQRGQRNAWYTRQRQ